MNSGNVLAISEVDVVETKDLVSDSVCLRSKRPCVRITAGAPPLEESPQSFQQTGPPPTDPEPALNVCRDSQSDEFWQCSGNGDKQSLLRKGAARLHRAFNTSPSGKVSARSPKAEAELLATFLESGAILMERVCYPTLDRPKNYIDCHAWEGGQSGGTSDDHGMLMYRAYRWLESLGAKDVRYEVGSYLGKVDVLSQTHGVVECGSTETMRSIGALLGGFPMMALFPYHSPGVGFRFTRGSKFSGVQDWQEAKAKAHIEHMTELLTRVHRADPLLTSPTQEPECTS